MAALWNGQPFFFPDTPTYLKGAEMGVARLAPQGSLKSWSQAADNDAPATAPATSPAATSAPAPASAAGTQVAPVRLTSIDDKVVLAGRSVYYGALLYLSYLAGPGSSLWLTVLAQALCVAYLLQLAMVRVWGLSTTQFLGTTAALSLVTPLAVYTGFLMPDIFAPMLILCVALLSTAWSRLRTADRWALSALLLYTLISHSSHVVIAAGLLALLLARKLWPRAASGVPDAGASKALGVLAACLVLAVVAETVFVKAVTQAVGAPPLRLPHPMARLIDAGPGTDYLKKNCPQAGYAACAYVKNFPTNWVDFMFSDDPAKGAFALADAATKRRMSGEQLRFAWAVTRADPLSVARVVGVDVLVQLGRFDTDIWSFGKDGIALFFKGRVPPEVLAQMQASRAAQTTAYNDWFTFANRIAVLVAVLLFALAWPKRRQLFGRSRFHAFAGVVLAGFASNAAVCAGLASSMDRFGARVIWLLPFLAVAGVMVMRAERRAAPSDRPGADAKGTEPAPALDPASKPLSDRPPASPLLGATS